MLGLSTLTAAAFDRLLPPSVAAYDPANEVDVELVLAVDISQSMDEDEQQVQRAGYVAAITSQEVMDAIRYGPTGRIAITYFEWGGVGEHFTVADWMVIEDEATAAAFAARIAEAPLRQVQRTSIFSALERAAMLVTENKYEGMRKVIDISGDGPNNQGGAVTEMRDKVIAAGFTINGLPLMMKSESSAWQAMLHLDHYYEDCVIGGPGAFAIPVRSKEGFADAIRMKLVLEIAGLMENQSMVVPAQARKPVSCAMFD
ncbi:DUF1194 domain-containing protein [Microvirga tunisiensis]|uniref:DUF1194 domain-containing protein n=3 Tax=Pannonibacter tanglangensis TaxID=2750084 RepID=A0ABW9ZIS0_9HYPH|nr:DUF1194 domain-containing protein [Pannonibacter sp. XCT-34]NBN79226.1 DUF1194 domain-containing protein [Pannonibacter sp. XCT-53]